MKTPIISLTALSLLGLMSSVHAADYSAGAIFGTTGLGLSLSLKNPLQLRDQDQFQTRFQLSGLDTDEVEDVEISGIDYEGDLKLQPARATMDWYPFTNRFFVSAGLDYSKIDFAVDSEDNQSYKIGSQQITASDDVTAKVDIDDQGLSPYLGIGWGNRLGEESGFSFLAEVGILVPTGDPDVEFSVTDPNNVVSAADIAAEKKQIEDDLDGVAPVASLGVMYHF